jgi:dTDP-4-amino-4,6-dideoxy-D-galactose acyltransferase
MIKELVWDSTLLKKKVGQLVSIPAEKHRLESLVEKTRAKGFSYITCRLYSQQVSYTQILESLSFYLTDIGVTFEMRTDKFLLKTRDHTLDNGLVVRTALRNDIPKLKKMSTSLFTDSRFYHDPFFSKKEADTLFQAWIENSVLGDAADIFYYVPDKGFITCKKMNAKTGEIKLIGVEKKFRSKGVGSLLMEKAVEWFKAHDIAVVNVRTQLKNMDAVNFYVKLGFSLKGYDLVYGKIL